MAIVAGYDGYPNTPLAPYFNWYQPPRLIDGAAPVRYGRRNWGIVGVEPPPEPEPPEPPP